MSFSKSFRSLFSVRLSAAAAESNDIMNKHEPRGFCIISVSIPEMFVLPDRNRTKERREEEEEEAVSQRGRQTFHLLSLEAAAPQHENLKSAAKTKTIRKHFQHQTFSKGKKDDQKQEVNYSFVFLCISNIVSTKL